MVTLCLTGMYWSRRSGEPQLFLFSDRLSLWLQSNQVFVLVKQLHLAGILHGDLEPRNVVRMAGGDFLLIDFTNSVTHICPDNDQLNVRSSALLYCYLNSYTYRISSCTGLPQENG
jgi:serine/threonine protein kinase